MWISISMKLLFNDKIYCHKTSLKSVLLSLILFNVEQDHANYLGGILLSTLISLKLWNDASHQNIGRSVTRIGHQHRSVWSRSITIAEHYGRGKESTCWSLQSRQSSWQRHSRCVYVCCIYICARACVRVCAYVFMCWVMLMSVRVCVCAHVCMCARARKRACMCVRALVCACVSLCAQESKQVRVCVFLFICVADMEHPCSKLEWACWSRSTNCPRPLLRIRYFNLNQQQ